MSLDLLTSAVSHQSRYWIEQVTELCQHLERAKYQKGTILLLEVQENIKVAIKKYWSKGNLVHKSLVQDLVQYLENKDICSRIHQSLLAVIAKIILRSEKSRFSERGIYLLGNLLINDSRPIEKSYQGPARSNKPDLIRKEFIPLLLEYLYSSDKNPSMRRWVGLLSFKLIQEHIKCHDKADVSLDKYRSRLDQVVIQSNDKLLSIICGRFSKDQTKKGTLIDRKFSRDNKTSATNRVQDDNNEKKLLIDNLESSSNHPNECQKQNGIFFIDSMTINPNHQSGDDYQEIYMTLEEDSLIILALMPTAGFDQIIEAPFKSISMLRFYCQQAKDKAAFSVINIQFKQGLENFIILNGKEVKLSNSLLRLSSRESRSFQDCLSKFLTGLRIEWETVSTGRDDSKDFVISGMTPHSSVCEIAVRGFSTVTSALSPKKTVFKKNYDQRYCPDANAAFGFDFQDHSVKTTEKIHETPTPIYELPEKGRFQGQFPIMRQKFNSKQNAVKPKAKQPLIASRRSIDHYRGQNSGIALIVKKKSSKISKKSDPTKDLIKDVVQTSNMVTTKRIFSSDSKPLQCHPENRQTLNLHEDEDKDFMARAGTSKKEIELGTSKRLLFLKRKTGTRASVRIIRKNEKLKSTSDHPAKSSQQTKEQKNIPSTEENEILTVEDPNFRSKQISRSPPIFKAGNDQNNLKMNLCLNLLLESDDKRLPCRINDSLQGSPIVDDLLHKDARLPGLAVKNADSKLDSSEYYNLSPTASHKLTKNIREEFKPHTCKISTPQSSENSFRRLENNLTLAEGLNFMMHEMNENCQTHSFDKGVRSLGQDTNKKHGAPEVLKPDICQFENTNSAIERVLGRNSGKKIPLSCISPQADLTIYSVQRIPVAKNGSQTVGQEKNSPKENLTLKSKIEGAQVAQEIQPPANDMISTLHGIPEEIISSEADNEVMRNLESEDFVLDSVKKRRIDENDNTSSDKKRRNSNQLSRSPTGKLTKLNKDPSYSRDKKGMNQQGTLKNGQQNLIQVVVPSLWQQQEPNSLKGKAPCYFEDKKISVRKKIPCKDNDLSNDNLVQKSLIVSFGSIGEGNQEKTSTSEDLDEKLKNEKMPIRCSNLDKKVIKEQRQKIIASLGGNNLLPEKSPDDHLREKKSLKGIAIYSTNPFSSKRDYASSHLIVKSSSPVSDIPMIEANKSAVGTLGLNSSPNRKTLGSTSRFFKKPASLTSSRRLSCQGPTVTSGGSPIDKKTCEDNYIKEMVPGLKQRTLTNQKHFKISDQISKACGEPGPSISTQRGFEPCPSSPLEDKTGLVLHETTDGVHYRDMNSHEVITQKVIQDPFYIRESQMQRQIPFLGLSGTRNKKLLVDNNVESNSSRHNQGFPRSEKPPIDELNRSDLTSNSLIITQEDKEKWNMTIRSRYQGVNNTIHRIADDLIIRLAEEEDRMKLLVNQYAENGANLVENLSKFHEEKNNLVLKLLETKKSEILDVESKAQASISEIFHTMNMNKISDTVKKWERLQDEIHLEIDEGRREST